MSQNPAECSAKLTGLADPVKGKEVPLAGLVKIGRDQKANTLAIGHASVSRQHAQLFQEGGAWVVEDLKSTNGIHVNEVKTPKTRLKDGDVVRIGDISFKFTLVQAVTQILAKPAGEPAQDLTLQSAPKPTPAPAAPALAARAAAAPAAAVSPPKPAAPPPKPTAPPPRKEEGGGGDLFEPSMIGQVQLPAGARQAAAEPQSSSRREPEDFEGTMYGPQVAKQLVKAIREEKEVPAAVVESSATGARPLPIPGSGGGGAKPINFFWLKIKSIVFMLVFLGLLVGGAAYLVILQNEQKTRLKQYNQLKVKVDKFVETYESKADNDVPKELEALSQLQTDIQTTAPGFAGHPEFVSKVRGLEDRVRFLAFERKLMDLIAKQNEKAASKLIEEMSAQGTPAQKELMPLAKLVVEYRVFDLKYHDAPATAVEAADRQLVTKVYDCGDEFTDKYRKSRYAKVEGQLFFRLSDEVATRVQPLVREWKKFWDAYKEYEDTKSAAKLEQLKKDYPKLKMLQDLK